MPSFNLTQAAASRLDVVSFFLVLYLVLTLIFKWLWNYLALDFKWMPRLTYLKALGLMVVCGMFLYVVLTMISGARELMTPTAWKKTGFTYGLVEPEQQAKPWLESARKQSLERLRAALWDYAKRHDGKLPVHTEADDFPREFWQGVDPDRSVYAYYPGRQPNVGNHVIAFEPYTYGSQRYVLFSTGEIEKMPVTEIIKRVEEEQKGSAPAPTPKP